MKKFLSVVLSALILLITHFLLLNFIELKKRRSPSQNIAKFLSLGNLEEFQPEIDSESMKNELLNYVQDIAEKNNTTTKVEIKPATNKVEGSNFYNKLADSEFGNDEFGLDKYFKASDYSNCQFKPNPTENKAEIKKVAEPVVEEKPKEENTLEKIHWKYDDERVMNGGEVFNGIFGYNSLDDNYATI